MVEVHYDLISSRSLVAHPLICRLFSSIMIMTRTGLFLNLNSNRLLAVSPSSILSVFWTQISMTSTVSRLIRVFNQIYWSFSDGMISKSEMKRYFVNANSHSLAFRRGFRHNFHETTFLTPTSCSHCGKFLWGLLRQGVKCKDCGIPVHRGCKDQLVEECRRKTSDKTIPLTNSRVSCPSSGDDSSDGIGSQTFPPRNFNVFFFFFLRIFIPSTAKSENDSRG